MQTPTYTIYAIYDTTNNKILYVNILTDEHTPEAYLLQLLLKTNEDRRNRLYKYINNTINNEPVLKAYKLDTVTPDKNINIQYLHRKYIQLFNPLLNDRVYIDLQIDDEERMTINEKLNNIIYCN